MGIQLTLDPGKYTTKPKQDAPIISNRIAKHKTQLSFKELVEAIASGKTISAVYKDDKRSKHNWNSQQVFCVDIDKGNYELEELLSIDCPIKPSIVYETFSSTQNDKRWRLVFICEYSIDNALIADAIRLMLFEYYSKHLEGVDKNATLDSARLFYGSASAVRYTNKNSFFDIEDVIEISNYIGKTTQKQYSNVSVDLPEQTQLLSLTRNQRRTLDFYFKQLIEDITNPHPSRYEAVWQTARKLASTGLVSEKDIFVKILAAMRMSNGKYDNWKYGDGMSVIKSGIVYGAKNHKPIPKYYTPKNKT